MKPSLSSAQYVSAWGSAVAFRPHDVISRERLPQMCDNTDTVRSAPIFMNFPNSAGLHDVHEIFFCTIHYLFPFSVQRTYSVAIIWLQEPNSCSWWTQQWKCEVWLSLSFNTRWKILEACVNADWEYFVDSVSEIKSILSFIFHAIHVYGAVSRGCMYSAHPFLLWWLWEYVYFILLSSSNRKYDPFPIA